MFHVAKDELGGSTLELIVRNGDEAVQVVRAADLTGHCTGAGRVEQANISSKPDYVFGEATGNMYNIQLLQQRQAESNRIGIKHPPSNRTYLTEHLDDALQDPSDTVGTEVSLSDVQGLWNLVFIRGSSKFI